MKKNIRAPQGKEKEFKKYWDLFLPQVKDRDNFHTSHLQQLEILCDLYVDYHNLTKFVREKGYSFMCDGRYGQTSRPFVEVQTRQKVIGEIRAYSKMLGLLLEKSGTIPDNDVDEWY